MAQAKNICTPLTDEVLADLKCGDMVNISGIIYTGRDAAHKIMVEMIEKGEPLPVDWDRQVIYYAGPTPAKPGRVTVKDPDKDIPRATLNRIEQQSGLKFR